MDYTLKTQPQKIDRRIRRTQKLLWEGLAEMMQTKDINEITVKDLTELVDINRSTFYIHYKDIYQLLDTVEQELFEQLKEIISPDSSNEAEPLQVLKALYDFLNSNRSMVTAFLGPHGDYTFLNKIQDLLSEMMQKTFFGSENSGVSEYYASFCFAGCIGVVKEWIKTGYAMPPEDIAVLTNRFLNSPEKI